MIKIKHKGDLSKTFNFLKKAKNFDVNFEKYAQRGLSALMNATPINSGKTAMSWKYTIVRNNSEYKIVYSNDNENRGVNIAVILQYGHGTRNGGWVEGINYINPAIQPVFDSIAEEAWRELIG